MKNAQIFKLLQEWSKRHVIQLQKFSLELSSSMCSVSLSLFSVHLQAFALFSFPFQPPLSGSLQSPFHLRCQVCLLLVKIPKLNHTPKIPKHLFVSLTFSSLFECVMTILTKTALSHSFHERFYLDFVMVHFDYEFWGGITFYFPDRLM